MRVLHICNDFCGSKVHANLYERLDAAGIEQLVFTYFRGCHKEGKNQFDAKQTQFVYKGILSIWDRALYHLKIRKVYHELIKEVNPQEYDIVHATTMFSDGAIAYQLYKDYGIPYIVAVRSCDTHTFLKYAPYTWRMGVKILSNARRIILITPVLQSRLCQHFVIRSILSEIKDRMVVQPNGIDDYWLENINEKPSCGSNNIIYVGTFIRRKHLDDLIFSVLKLRREYPDLKLHIVGGLDGRERRILKLVNKHSDTLTYHGQITDKNVLKGLYRQCRIFAMPSTRETFGLVYIEALTQNLQLLYAQHESIDGLLDSHVGVAVNAHSQKRIEEGLKKLLEQQSLHHISDYVEFEQFRWRRIAENYKLIYNEVLTDQS